jgi:hypothetical protein
MTTKDAATERRTIRDPFIGKDVEISNRLTDRLRGKYANGPTMPNGEPEFGWRVFPTPPIQHQAADEIDSLLAKNADLIKALEPFARISLIRDSDPGALNDMIDGPDLAITPKQIRAARAAIGKARP